MRSLADKWREVSRRIELWVEIQVNKSGVINFARVFVSMSIIVLFYFSRS